MGVSLFGLLMMPALKAFQLPPPTAAQTPIYYVAPEADCGMKTFILNCYDNVQAAVDAAPAGAEIRIAAGIYTHTHQHGSVRQALYLSKTLTLRGGYTRTNWSTPYPFTQPTFLDAQGQGRVLHITGDISPHLENLIIQGGVAGDSSLGGGLYVDTARTTFANMVICNNSAGYGGGMALFNSEARFTNTIVAQNRASALGSGIYAVRTSLHVWHTTLADNAGGNSSGLHLVEGYAGATIIPSTAYLTNTIVSGQETGIYVNSGNTAILTHTLWHSNTQTWDGWGRIQSNTDLSGDPDFVGAAHGDYHIGVRSAARDAGIEAGVRTDIDGEARSWELAPDVGADECWRPGMIVTQRAAPEPVKAGTWLTYTIQITNVGALDLDATITDTLPHHITTDPEHAGTVILSGGKLIWTTAISPGAVWAQTVAVKVDLEHDEASMTIGYNGPLINTVSVSTLQGISGTVAHTTTAFYFHHIFLPVIMQKWVPPKNVLTNPGFEGIGLPEDNDAPNPGNWTRDTFNGVEYGEIFTPEGWVTWWEEDVGTHGRPEAHVIPREIPYTFDPIRIDKGYYAATYFTFWRTHNAGYYQRVTELPPGIPVSFYAYAHGWSCDGDNPLGYSCGDPENLGFRVGVDPTGGTDPWSENIIWSERTLSPDVYRHIGPVCGQVGPEGAITVFLRSDAKWPYKHNDAYWDNAALMVPIP